MRTVTGEHFLLSDDEYRVYDQTATRTDGDWVYGNTTHELPDDPDDALRRLIQQVKRVTDYPVTVKIVPSLALRFLTAESDFMRERLGFGLPSENADSIRMWALVLRLHFNLVIVSDEKLLPACMVAYDSDNSREVARYKPRTRRRA